ncbi:MAG: ribonuclease P protein component 4 [Promethearchaeia archaeon]
MPRYRKTKQIIKKIARKRMKFLFELASETLAENRYLANRYAYLARRYAQKAKIRIPFKWKRLICHNCKQFLSPGVNCRYRLQSRKGKGSHISMTCLECGATTRYYIKAKKPKNKNNKNN